MTDDLREVDLGSRLGRQCVARLAEIDPTEKLIVGGDVERAAECVACGERS
jgi:hypothetical protein